MLLQEGVKSTTTKETDIHRETQQECAKLSSKLKILLSENELLTDSALQQGKLSLLYISEQYSIDK